MSEALTTSSGTPQPRGGKRAGDWRWGSLGARCHGDDVLSGSVGTARR